MTNIIKLILENQHVNDILYSSDHAKIIDYLKGPSVSEADISTALRSDRPHIRTQAIKHPNATQNNINMAINDPHPDVRKAAIDSPNASDELLKGIIKKETEDGYQSTRNNVMRNGLMVHVHSLLFKRNPQYILDALEHPWPQVRAQAFGTKSPVITSSHIEQGLKDVDHVAASAIKHPNATVEQLTRAIDHSNFDIRLGAVTHPKATLDMLNKGINDPSDYFRSQTLHHPKATPEMINKGVYDTSRTDVPVVQDGTRITPSVALNSNLITPEHIDHLINNGNSHEREKAVQHSNATKQNLENALTNKNGNVRRIAASRLKKGKYQP